MEAEVEQHVLERRRAKLAAGTLHRHGVTPHPRTVVGERPFATDVPFALHHVPLHVDPDVVRRAPEMLSERVLPRVRDVGARSWPIPEAGEGPRHGVVVLLEG